MTGSLNWGSDTPVSMPESRPEDPYVNVGGGWIFTAGGIRHNVTDAEIEVFGQPTFAPLPSTQVAD